MPARRHPLRTIYLYSETDIWWRVLMSTLEDMVSTENAVRRAPGDEHWRVRPGPSASAARRQMRSAPAVFIAANTRLPELEKALQYRPSPVHIVYDHMTHIQRKECQKQGWLTWRIPDIHPDDIVAIVRDYCYPT